MLEPEKPVLGPKDNSITFDNIEKAAFALKDRYKAAAGDPDTIKLLKDELLTFFRENSDHTTLRAMVMAGGDLAPLIDCQRSKYFTFFATNTRYEIDKILRENEPRFSCCVSTR